MLIASGAKELCSLLLIAWRAFLNFQNADYLFKNVSRLHIWEEHILGLALVSFTLNCMEKNCFSSSPDSITLDVQKGSLFCTLGSQLYLCKLALKCYCCNCPVFHTCWKDCNKREKSNGQCSFFQLNPTMPFERRDTDLLGPVFLEQWDSFCFHIYTLDKIIFLH